MSGKSAENELLMLAARPTLDLQAVNRLRSSLREIADWQYVLDMAQDHGLVPLLFQHLQSMGASEVPSQDMLRLRKLSEANTNSALHLTGELIRLLGIFKANDIEAVPFKGPTLSLLAYGDLALRQFADLDILVRRRDVARVRTQLARHGFVPVPQLTTGQEAALVRFDCAQNFSNRENVVVDIHWGLAPRYLSIDLNADTCWDNVQNIEIGQTKTHTLSQENLVLALAIHGLTHYWERLGWISDIGALIVRNKTDWPLLLQTASQPGLRRILMIALFLTNDMLEAPVPLEVLESIRKDPKAVELADRFAQTFRMNSQSFQGPIKSALLPIVIRERVRHRVLSAVRLLITPRSFDWMSFSAPASFWFAYYLVRPIRLVLKHANQLVRGRIRPPTMAGESISGPG